MLAHCSSNNLVTWKASMDHLLNAPLKCDMYIYPCSRVHLRSSQVCWDMTLYRWVCGFRRFKGRLYLYLHGSAEPGFPGNLGYHAPKNWVLYCWRPESSEPTLWDSQILFFCHSFLRNIRVLTPSAEARVRCVPFNPIPHMTFLNWA